MRSCESVFESLPEVDEGLPGDRQRLDAGRRDRESALPIPLPTRRGRLDGPFHQAFLLQPVEGGVQGAPGDFPPGSFFQDLADSRSICLVVELQRRQEDHVFELSQEGFGSHGTLV